MHIVMRQLHGQYGRLVRTAPNEISVADISAIKEIYGPGSKFVKAPWYSVWKGTQKVDLFAEREIGVHATLRRNVSRMYAMSSVTSLEPWVDNAIGCFMDQMRSRVGQPIDFGVWLQLLAFDVIGEISFSRRFGFLEAGCDDGTLNRIERALRSLCWVGQVPWVYWLEHYLSPIFGHHLDVKLRHGRIRTTAAKEVSARKTRPTEHQDILGHLFQVQQAKPDQVDENTVTSIATANIFAGSDTTAISLRAVFYFLLRNPHCLHKLMDEIETGHADGRLSFPVRFSQASDMPYLQACINEALRLHPAVGMSLPRVVPPGGMKIGSNFIPEGVSTLLFSS
jgi:cytochrome P450